MILLTTDPLRKLVELAVAAGRKRQSKQTGFIHHHYHADEEEIHQSIPLVENALFCLALFRSRTIENMEEANSLLGRLLQFQSAEGNFPIYLHDFPQCHDHFLGSRLLIPFYWMRAGFGSMIKHELDQKVERLLHFYVKLAQEMQIPCVPFLRIAAAAQSFGLIWKDSTWIEWGKSQLEKQSQIFPSIKSHSPLWLSEVIPAFTLLERQLVQIEQHWDPQLLAYAGPAEKEWQQESQPQVTLYDFYMGLHSSHFSKRALKDTIVHLQAALLHREETLEKTLTPSPYHLYLNRETVPEHDKAFHHMRLVWGDKEQLHTLACQGGNMAHYHFVESAERVEMEVTLDFPPPDGDREKSREVAFYLNTEAVKKIEINGKSATTFALGDQVTIYSEGLKLHFCLMLLEGEGDFVGHLMRGNRPSQLFVKSKNRPTAYDWQLFLRTLRRQQNCRLKVVLQIEPSKDASP